MKRLFAHYEWILWLIMLAPGIVLAWCWSDIPEIIPTHYNIAGEADDWNSKNVLLWMSPALMLGLYVLLLAVPTIDPKQRIAEMGQRYFAIRLITLGFIALILSVWIYSTAYLAGNLIRLLIPAFAVFITVLGIYLQTVKPNYFIGIRTPWSLNDDENWQKTHRAGSRIYTIGGVLLFVASIFGIVWQQDMNIALFVAFMSIVLAPFFVSFYYFLRSKRSV